MSKRPLKARVLLAIPLALILIWAVAGAAQTNPFYAPLKAGKLMGMIVEDTDGQGIGTIRNLILDTRTGELKYAVIGSGGILGINATLRLAPSQILNAGTAKRATLGINTTADHWKRAPVFKRSKLSSLVQSGAASEIAAYFAPDHTARPLTATGTRTSAPMPVLRFASDIIGSRVVDQKQQKIGEVLDLLVSFGEPQPAFAIITSSRLSWRAHQYAVPLNALKPTDENRKMRLHIDITALPNAPVFNRQTWESGGTNYSDRVYRYLKNGQ